MPDPAETMKERALRTLRESPDGLSTRALAYAMEAHAGSLDKRLKALLRDGLVVVTDEVRGGAEAKVWRAA